MIIKPVYLLTTSIVMLLVITLYFYETGRHESSQDQYRLPATEATPPLAVEAATSSNLNATPAENEVAQNEGIEGTKMGTVDAVEEKSQEVLSTMMPAQVEIAKSNVFLPNEISNLLSQLDAESQTQEIIKLISQYDSPEAAEIFLSYLIDNQELPDELQKALIDSLNSTADRERVAALIADSFIDLSDPTMRDKLLTINQPESLEKISLFALEQGDIETYDKAVERLKSNPSEHTFDALMTMYQSDYSNYTDLEGFLSTEVIASDWAYQQLSGSRLDFIEQKLEANEYSGEEKDFILLILGASEDQDRGNELIKKFWGVNEQ